MLLATPQDLATYMQTATQAEADAGSPNVLDTAVATQALEAASGLVRNAAGWSITEETATKTVFSWGPVFLPSLHVTDVAVSFAETPLVDGFGFTFNPETGVVHLNPYLRPVVLPWNGAAGVVVTYTHGWPSVPDSVRSVCLELAAGILGNPSGAASVTYGNVTETYRRGDVDLTSLRADPRLASYVLTNIA